MHLPVNRSGLKSAASGWCLASALHRADLGDLTEAGSASVELRRGARALLAAVDAAVSGQLVVRAGTTRRRWGDIQHALRPLPGCAARLAVSGLDASCHLPRGCARFDDRAGVASGGSVSVAGRRRAG